MARSSNRSLWVLGTVLVLGTVGVFACQSDGAGVGAGDAVAAAEAVYVAPGEYDEFYAFMSGGFSGQLTVMGLPSGRLLRQVPVFSQYPENGWGYSEETKPMLQTSHGFIPWDDSHHPELSMTDGVPDGRWIFINANNTPRVARIDLSSFDAPLLIECNCALTEVDLSSMSPEASCELEGNDSLMESGVTTGGSCELTEGLCTCP